jgi:radical SAM superfamily enzyme YgiQ (UPF0313 family)
MPLGLLRLASCLGEHPVVIVDGRLDLAPESRVAELAREGLCLGSTVRTGPPIADALRISRAARTASPGLPVIWGGRHATLFPAQCLASGAVDACALGPGEETIAEAAAALRAGRALQGIAGLAWREGEKVASGELRAPLHPARLPRADYGLLDVERYFESRGKRRLDYVASLDVDNPAPTATGGFPAERVVAEVRDLAARFHLAEVAFQDEDFFADPRRAEDISRGFLEAGVHIGWSAMGTGAVLRRLGDDWMRAIAGGGCRLVYVRTPGAASLTGDTADAIQETAAKLHGAGIGARFSFTAGFPGRGKEGLKEIQRLALALRRIDSRFETPIRLHAPYPGGPGADPPGFRVPETLDEWGATALDQGGPWIADPIAVRVARSNFFLAEAYRPPGRRWAKRLLRGIARIRVRLGFYALDVERHAVEWAARARTGRSRGAGHSDD